METAQARLTVLFEEPFWVGVFEREAGGRYCVCKVTFGAEPRDFEVYQYILDRWHTLAFSPALASPSPDERRINPKRRQRMLREQASGGVGTKAQQALQLQREQGKALRQSRAKQRREAEQERKYQLHQEKRKEKHRGH